MVERRKAPVWDVLEGRHPRAPGAAQPRPDVAPSRHPGLRARAGRGQGHPDPPAGLHGVQRRLRRRPDGRAPPAVGRGPGRGAHPDALGEQHPLAGDRSPHHRAHPGHGLRRLLPDAAGRGGQGRRPGLPPRLRDRGGVRRRRLGLQVPIPLRPAPGSGLAGAPGRRRRRAATRTEPLTFETTPGRVFFNEALPEGFRYVNDVVGKRNTPIGTIVEELSANYPKHVVASSLDRIKALGFRFAAQSGLTISINDVADAAGQAGDPGPLREGGREGRDPVQARHHHRRRAAPEGDRDLDARPTPRWDGPWRPSWPRSPSTRST